MIVIFFSCDSCGEEKEVHLTDAQALKFQPIPKGWAWVRDQGFCASCRRYEGIEIGDI